MDLSARQFSRYVTSPHQPAWMTLAFLWPGFQRQATVLSSVILPFSISSGLQSEGFSHLINNPFQPIVTSV